MGLMKEFLIEQQERGYYYIGDKYVCSKCFDDYAICNFIERNAQKPVCDYCGNSSSDKLIAAPIDDVIGLIVEGIEFEWGDPNNEGVPWESKEGGWQGKVYDAYEILVDQVELTIENEKLFQDILNSISNRQWCQKNFYQLPPEKVLILGWDEFSKQVKYNTRYVFFRVENSNERYHGSEEIPPAQMLDRLAGTISETRLVRILEKGTLIYRVRKHEVYISYTTAAELGPPPPEKAIYSNRISPAGIPMFYGAFDKQTALLETYQNDKKGQCVATIAAFRTLKPLKVIDLTELPEVPSLFDSERRYLRSGIIFLKSFEEEISKPIEKDGREHIEYVPTQVFTEYFRHIYLDEDGEGVKGILYPSSRKKGGISCVLFFHNQHFCDQWEDMKKDDYKWFLLENTEKKRVTYEK